MAIQYAAALRTTRITDVLNAIDAGGAAGSLEICTAAFAAILSQHTLSYPCGTVSGDTLTFSAIGADSSINNTGTAAVARIKTSAGVTVVTNLTVGTSLPNEVIVDTTSFVSGGTANVLSGTITHAT